MFDDRLKKLRESIGMTQKEVANLLDLNPRTYSSYENNEREPSADIVIRIAETFDVSLDYLLGIDKKRLISRDLGRKQDMPLTTPEVALIYTYRNLPTQGKAEFQKLADMLNVYYCNAKPGYSTERNELIAERIAAADKKIAEDMKINKS